MSAPQLPRRQFLGAALTGGAAALGCRTADARARARASAEPQDLVAGRPTLVGSANALPGMKQFYSELVDGAAPLDVAIEVVKVKEKDPGDRSVGLGGLPNEDGVVQLDAAVMDGRTANAGSVACIENILHPSEVARLVMERTDHCMIVGRGAYDFARMHGHPHTELLTERTRQIWLRWRESMSDRDDRLPPPPAAEDAEEKQGSVLGEPLTEEELAWIEDPRRRLTGTIHCSALAADGHVACTTTTSGLSWKIPGRVGDSPIIGAGLYCDQEAGSAGATGRGEAAILSHGSSAIVELLRQGMAPVDAGLEVLRRITRQAQRNAAWQPGLVDEEGVPTFGLLFYILGLDGAYAGVSLKGTPNFAVADPENGPRHERCVGLHPG